MDKAVLPSLLYGSVLDTLDQQICVINRRGDILYVNQAWIAFNAENGGPPTNWQTSNYLEVCNAASASLEPDAVAVSTGIQQVLQGHAPHFRYEYPCNSPQEPRWFLMQIKPLSDLDNLYVISHLNITQRKLAEMQAEMLSTHDPLTGLSNRRHFEQFLQHEWKSSMREHTPLSIIMLDIDHFKTLNDQHGHQAGDICIKRVADIIGQASRRAKDLAVRWGGEEFILLLSNTTSEAALRIAEDIRLKIEAMPAIASMNITISAGIASAIPEGNPETLIAFADKALYQAKASGRNKVICSSASAI